MTKLELRVLYIEARNASHAMRRAMIAAEKANRLFYDAFQNHIGAPTDEEFAELHDDDKASLLARLASAMLEGFAGLAEARQITNEEPEDHADDAKLAGNPDGAGRIKALGADVIKLFP